MAFAAIEAKEEDGTDQLDIIVKSDVVKIGAFYSNNKLMPFERVYPRGPMARNPPVLWNK